MLYSIYFPGFPHELDFHRFSIFLCVSIFYGVSGRRSLRPSSKDGDSDETPGLCDSHPLDLRLAPWREQQGASKTRLAVVPNWTSLFRSEKGMNMELIWNYMEFLWNMELIKNLYGTYMELWNLYGTMEFIWNFYGTMELIWKLYGTMELIWNLYGTMELIWNLYGTMELTWNLYGTMELTWIFYGTYNGTMELTWNLYGTMELTWIFFYGTYMELWNLYGIYMQLWNLYGAYMEIYLELCNFYGIYMELWNLYEVYMEHIWNLYGTMELVWNLYGTMELLWNLYGTKLLYIGSVHVLFKNYMEVS